MLHKSEGYNSDRIGAAPSERSELDDQLVAKKLLKLLIEDLDPEDFPLEDIRSNYNEFRAASWTEGKDGPKLKGKGQTVYRFNSSHLNALQKEGLIAESGERG